MGLPTDKIALLLGGLGIASVGLASLALLVAALTVALRGSGAIVGLLLVPLAIPMLIFGAGALRPGGEGGLLLLGAVSLFLTAIIPFAAAAALRSGRE
jgi:heme exporter protein B